MHDVAAINSWLCRSRPKRTLCVSSIAKNTVRVASNTNDDSMGKLLAREREWILVSIASAWRGLGYPQRT